MKICNSCGFECENEATLCPTCGKSCDGSDTQKDIPMTPDPFREYREKIDMQIKEQEKRIEEISQKMLNEQEKNGKKAEKRDKSKWDKTELFSEDEVKKHRLTAVLIYLLGIFGVMLALLTDKESLYLNFHIKEELKITTVTAFLTLMAIVLFWTFIIPVICTVGIIVCSVINLIAAYRTLKGKSENAVIIRNLSILD